MAKGANFERAICKQLSLWWTGGERDDVFWRSSQSGGRATMRARKGKTTAGGNGDICALDPIGGPLLKVFTIELKRGRSHGEPGDLLDCAGSEKCHPFLATLKQAKASADGAGNFWLIIVRRDRRRAVVFFPMAALKEMAPLGHARQRLVDAPAFAYRVADFNFMGVSLEKFLRFANPRILGAENK